MTLELNVRITLSERSNSQKLEDVDYADVIRVAIHEYTTNYNVKVEVHTVTPESANPKKGECKYYKEGDYSDCLIDNGICPWFPIEQGRKCKYYKPKREEQ